MIRVGRQGGHFVTESRPGDFFFWPFRGFRGFQGVSRVGGGVRMCKSGPWIEGREALGA